MRQVQWQRERHGNTKCTRGSGSGSNNNGSCCGSGSGNISNDNYDAEDEDDEDYEYHDEYLRMGMSAVMMLSPGDSLSNSYCDSDFDSGCACGCDQPPEHCLAAVFRAMSIPIACRLPEAIVSVDVDVCDVCDVYVSVSISCSVSVSVSDCDSVYFCRPMAPLA
ncbi:GL19965 [Drosophila persimilis]|uniref:GL19965 n=1 Tax=Drosophila persimilis TaxID=7234 RepID=B4GYQ0_DROPE|nr:GL19965 [Drosophila persimilis]